jgi:hypothetical protein
MTSFPISDRNAGIPAPLQRPLTASRATDRVAHGSKQRLLVDAAEQTIRRAGRPLTLKELTALVSTALGGVVTPGQLKGAMHDDRTNRFRLTAPGTWDLQRPRAW